MAYKRVKFRVGHWYHCYARSIGGGAVFLTAQDYERFLQALYLCNGTRAIKRGALYLPSHEKLFTLDRGEPLASVAAYCIMPDRFHILAREIRHDGISRFMQKVGTSYSMYFNSRKARAGNLFVRPFRSLRVHSDDHARHVLQYIHLDAAELFESEWRSGKVASSARLRKQLTDYRYSSLRDHERYVRAENNIIDRTAIKTLDDYPSLKDVLSDATEYFKSLPM